LEGGSAWHKASTYTQDDTTRKNVDTHPCLKWGEHDNEYLNYIKVGNFFTSWTIISFSRRSLLHGVSYLWSYECIICKIWLWVCKIGKVLSPLSTENGEKYCLAKCAAVMKKNSNKHRRSVCGILTHHITSTLMFI